MVLLYGSKIWVVMGAMIQILEGFNRQSDIRIAGKTALHMVGGEWVCPPVTNALETTGIWPIKEYIQRRYTTIAAQVGFRIIYDMCMGAERILGSIRFMR